jgi:hypothetical protein
MQLSTVIAFLLATSAPAAQALFSCDNTPVGSALCCATFDQVFGGRLVIGKTCESRPIHILYGPLAGR